MISMKLEGGARLAQNLSKLGFTEQRGVLVKILKHGAEPMAARMEQLAPVEEGKPDLRDHISISSTSKVAGPETLGSRRLNEGEAAVAVGPEKAFFYGLFQEFGTVRHGAQPFMRPAFDEKSGEALKLIQEDIWAHLRAQAERSTSGRTL